MGRGQRLLAACVLCCALAAPTTASTGWLQLGYVWPAQGTITTPFTPYHDGIDIGELRTLTVRASAAGTVELVGQPYGYEGYGNVIVVRVAPSIITIYAHLASWSVKVGDTVLPSQPIALAGCTGICTGTHLHFEVRVNGSPVNPVALLD
jgi:murein DD-endopeptidase MepM/ murein hydrolase activator NlpD